MKKYKLDRHGDDGDVGLFKFNTKNDIKKKFIDYNDFKQKLGSLRKYCPRSYKDLIFRFFQQTIKNENGSYTEEILTPKDFAFVYGKVQVKYTIKDGVMILENLEPAQFLIDGYMKELHTHRGLFYRDKKDIAKIDFYRNVKEIIK